MTNQNESAERAPEVEPPISEVNVNASGTGSNSSGPLSYARVAAWKASYALRILQFDRRTLMYPLLAVMRST